MRRCSFEHPDARARHIALLRDRLVESEHQSNRLVDLEKRSSRDRRDRSVSSEPKPWLASVADIAGADCVRAFCASIVGRGIDAYANVRPSSDRSHLTDEQLRTEQSAVPRLFEARAEIRDLDSAAFLVVESRDEYRSIGEILLLGSDRSLELDRAPAESVAGRFTAKERAKNRVAIESRKAAPDDGGLGVDQRANAAVANQRQVQGSHRRTVNHHAAITQAAAY